MRTAPSTTLFNTGKYHNNLNQQLQRFTTRDLATAKRGLATTVVHINLFFAFLCELCALCGEAFLFLRLSVSFCD